MFLLLFVYLTKISRLKTLYVSGNEIYVSDFFWEKSYKISEIRKLNRWMITMYRLKVEKDGKCYNYLIMPSVRKEIMAQVGLIEETEIEYFIKNITSESSQKSEF